MQCHPYYELLPTKYELIFFFLTFSLSDLLFPPFAVYHRLRIARMSGFFDRLAALADVELLIDVFQVRLDGSVRN